MRTSRLKGMYSLQLNLPGVPQISADRSILSNIVILHVCIASHPTLTINPTIIRSISLLKIFTTDTALHSIFLYFSIFFIPKGTSAVSEELEPIANLARIVSATHIASE